ncbi:hypothetical protein AAVH_11965 [Aphelenchoides avenae]|nr:hypothetical protein AAVH_11965 [Aphelenchus avenae]
MASSSDEDLSPTGVHEMYYIDDDPYGPYTQAAQKPSKKRRPWSGANPPAPLAEVSTATAAATTSASTSQTAAESSTSPPAPLAVANAATSPQTEPKNPANQSESATTGETTSANAQIAVSTFRFAPLALPATESRSKSPPIVVSKQTHKAAALSKIYAKDLNKQTQKLAPKKIIVKLNPRKPQEHAEQPRPTSPRPIVELASAQGVRTVAELKAAAQIRYKEWTKARPPGSTPVFFSPTWKFHSYGKILWREFCQLEPAIRALENYDAGVRQRAAAGSDRPCEEPPTATTSSTSEEERQQHLSEWERQFLPRIGTSEKTMSEEEARAAEAAVLGTEQVEELDYNEEMPTLQPPPAPPTEDELMRDLSAMLQPPTKPQSAATASGPYCNPPPPEPTKERVSPPPAPTATVCPPGSSVTVQEKVQKWLHSGTAPSIKQASAKAKEAAKSSSDNKEGHRSRQESGTKRTHVTSGTSAVPPAQRRRDGSSSPVRDKSPGVKRKVDLRTKTKKPPLPLLDGFACKDAAILHDLNGQRVIDVQWTASLDQANDEYLFLGVINGIGSPSVYLPEGAYKQIEPDDDHPLANLTRKDFDVEQSILPSKFILAHAVGAFPEYAHMITQESHDHLTTELKPNEKYYNGLRVGGTGPTGYTLCGVPDEDYAEVLEIQQAALITFARAARRAKRCLQVMISFDRKPPNDINLHADAIHQLKTKAKCDSNQAIHLVMYNGTPVDLLKWLKDFPKTVIGISLHQLMAHLSYIEKLPPATEQNRDSKNFRMMLRCIPMDNLVVQSLCPMPIEGSPGRHYSPYQLLGISETFEKLTETPGSGAALHSHSANNLRRVYNLSPELLTHLARATDRRPDRLNLDDFLAVMDEYLSSSAVARADSQNQEESPMEDVEEGAAAPVQQPRQRRESFASRSPSPTKSKDDHQDHHRKADSNSAPLAAEEKAKEKPRSKPAPLAVRDSRTEHRARDGRKEHSARNGHHSKDRRSSRRSRSPTRDRRDSRRSRSPMRSRSSAHSSHHRSRRERSPSRHHRHESEDNRRLRTPAKNLTRRIVVLTPSTDGEDQDERRPPADQDDDAVFRRPSLMSQVVVPNSTTNELRIFSERGATPPPTTQIRVIVPQKADSKPKRLSTPSQAAPPSKEFPQLRIVVPQDTQRRTSSTSSNSARQPTTSTGRVSVSKRIAYTASKPKPYSVKEDLRNLHHNRRGVELPAPLADAPSSEEDGPDPLLKPEPVLTESAPVLTSIEEYLEAARPYFDCKPVAGSSKKSISVNVQSLATEELPRAQPHVIHVTHGCDLPWDPIHLCNGDNEDPTHFHRSIGDAGLVHARRRWVQARSIKNNDRLIEFVDATLELNVHCFGQMVLIKYANRLKGDDGQTPNILRFIHEVLAAQDPENDLPEILLRYHPLIIRSDAERPWPDYQDFERAAEAWVCYCEEAFAFLFERLNGPVTWNPEWLQNNELPLAARQSIINHMVNQAQKMFDELRHQLYLQYGRRHIDAKDRTAFRWARFDDLLIKRIQINPMDVLLKPTVCFVDQYISEAFGSNLRPSVDMFVVPDADTDAIRAFIRRFYPTGAVQRVVFWFGRRFLLSRRSDYRDLVASLCHHYSVYFGRLHQYIVLPPFIRDRFNLWTDGPLATFIQRDVVAPHARVVLDHDDLHHWYGQAKELNEPLPAYIDSRGRLTEDGATARKNRLTCVHGLDLWHGPFLRTSESQPASSSKKARKGLPAPLADVPTKATCSTSAEPTSRRSRKDLDLETYATFLAKKIGEELGAKFATRIDALEKVVASVEQQDTEMDEDALSEATPYKDRSSKQ